MSKEQPESGLSTADFAAAAAGETRARSQHGAEPHLGRDAEAAGGQQSQSRQPSMDAGGRQAGSLQGEALAALFPSEVAQDFRTRWDTVQIGFVDDPRRAVQQADELVAQVMKSLAQSFTRQREQVEADVGRSDTESLRVALRGYRSFFERLLSL